MSRRSKFAQRGGRQVPPRLHIPAPATAQPVVPQSPRGFGIRTEGGATDPDEPLLTPRRLAAQVGAFSEMTKHGSGWGDALVAALRGHKMTEEQAALCLQTYWRRHEAVVGKYARGLAAEHIQAQFRERLWLRDGAAAAVQAALRGAMSRRTTDHELVRARAVTRLAAQWRGRVARQEAGVLRAKRKKLQRSFSWGSKSKNPRRRASAGDFGDGAKELAANRPVWDDGEPGPKSNAAGSRMQRVRRSLSFDRKKSSSLALALGIGGKENENEKGCVAIGSDAAPPTPRANKRTMVVERGPRGLGLELDATNTIVNIPVGGRADQQGVLMVGDTILTIDGKSLAGMLLQDALALLTSHPSAYVMEVRRPVPVIAPRSQLGSIRRSLSFDRRLR